MIFPPWRGDLTISLVTSLQLLHTQPQATTFCRSGHWSSVASTRRIISPRSSGSIVDHETLTDSRSTPFSSSLLLDWGIFCAISRVFDSLKDFDRENDLLVIRRERKDLFRDMSLLVCSHLCSKMENLELSRENLEWKIFSGKLCRYGELGVKVTWGWNLLGNRRNRIEKNDLGVGCYLVLGDGGVNVGFGFVCSINATKKYKNCRSLTGSKL